MVDSCSKFSSMVREWIVEFHGEIGPKSEEEINKRVQTYIKQEDLYIEKVGFILSLVPNVPRQVLDVGSSAGGLSIAIARNGIKTHGIEPLASGIEVSRERALRLMVENVSFEKGIGESIQFEENTFDLVVSLAVLEHVQNVEKVVSEIFRVLKPGGVTYIEVPNNFYPYESHYKMVWLPMMPKWLAKCYVSLRGANPRFLDGLHYMNRPYIIDRFRRAGFSKVRDVYAEFMIGKVTSATWAQKKYNLKCKKLITKIFRLAYGYSPFAWFSNRAVYIIAYKPENSK